MKFKKTIVYSLLFISVIICFKAVAVSIDNPAVFLAKLQKLFQNQQLIDSKLKNIESLTDHIRMRVYRKTGFYR